MKLASDVGLVLAMVLELVRSLLYLMSEEAITKYLFRFVKFINILMGWLLHK